MRDLFAASESVGPTPRGVAGFDRNGWPTSVGTGGRIASESVATLARITQRQPAALRPVREATRCWRGVGDLHLDLAYGRADVRRRKGVSSSPTQGRSVASVPLPGSGPYSPYGPYLSFFQIVSPFGLRLWSVWTMWTDRPLLYGSGPRLGRDRRC